MAWGALTVLAIFLTAGCSDQSPADAPPPVAAKPEPTADSSGVILYVSPTGDDTAAGTREAPFATIERARDELRQLKRNTGLLQGATVFIGGGSYPIRKTLRFTEEDSGGAGAPIVYQALPGEEAVLLGGVAIPSSELRPMSDPAQKSRIMDPVAAEKILEVDLTALGVSDVGQLSRRGYHRAGELAKTPPAELFVDGAPQTLARWPNVGETVEMGEILDPGPLAFDVKRMAMRRSLNFKRQGNEALASQMEAAIGRAKMEELLSDNRTPEEYIPCIAELGTISPDLHTRGGTFRFEYDRPLRWADSDDIWISGIFGLSWEYSYNQVASFDKTNRSVTLRYGEASGLNKNWFQDFHHYENVFEEIDTAGEYYIDRQRGRLYVYLPEGISDRSEVVLSILDQPLLETAGASHLEFRGLSFVGGRKDGVVLSGGREVMLSDCTIRSVAGDGAVIRGCFGSGLRHCEISRVGGSGVSLGGGDWANLKPGGNFVDRCIIHDFAYRDKAYHPGVEFAGKSVGNRVTGSRIYNGPHGGIIIKGNDHMIEGNELHALCRDFLDFGAIYTNAGNDPMDRGTQILRNYIHDIRPDVQHGVDGVYLDVMCFDIKSRHNVLSDIGGRAFVMKGHYLVAEDNLVANVPIAVFGAAADGLPKESWRQTFAQFPPESAPHWKRYPELARFWEDIERYGLASGPLNLFAGNTIFDPKGRLETETGVNAKTTDFSSDTDGGLTLAPRQENNLVLKEDPGFADWKKGDFRYVGSDPEMKTRLAFLNELFDVSGRFLPTAGAGVRQ